MRTLILGFLCVAACTPGGGMTEGSTTSAETSGASSSGVGATETSAASDPTTGPTGSGTSGSATTPGTETGSMTTTPPETSATESMTSEPGTSGPGTSGPGETTSGPVGGPCMEDADCKLHSDCCACEGVPVDVEPANCEMECKQPLCQEFGVDMAVCRLGVCETERLSCDQTQVVCDAPPPVCAPGTLPETSPGCWTGRCVPAALCDAVPDCTWCGPGSMCVKKVGEGLFPTVCEPIPPGCEGVPSCACAGELVCTGIFNQCFEQDDAILCECPNC